MQAIISSINCCSLTAALRNKCFAENDQRRRLRKIDAYEHTAPVLLPPPWHGNTQKPLIPKRLQYNCNNQRTPAPAPRVTSNDAFASLSMARHL